jgi:hypothetical protein
MPYIGMNASATETGMVTMGMMADGNVPEEDQDDDRDDDDLLDQLVLHRVDGRVDQLGAVVGRDDLDALGQ